MDAKKWIAGIFSILLLITPAFTQNRGEPGKNPPGDKNENPPERPLENQPEKPPVKPDGTNPDRPNPERPDPNRPNPHDKNDFYNFRGYRKIIINDSIEVVNAYVTTTPSSSFFFFRNYSNPENENEIVIRLHFNQSINPRSLTSEDVLVNNESLPPESQVLFNKNSDVMTIKIIPNEPAEESNSEGNADEERPDENEIDFESIYKIELNHVTSMDGKVSEHITVSNIKQSKPKKN